MNPNSLKQYCAEWNLSQPVTIASTFTSDVYRVICNGQDAVLKVFTDKGKQFESSGSIVLRYFDGCGAIRLLNADEGAHLLEYADGKQLKELVAGGEDRRATEIVCDVVDKLHTLHDPVPSGLISMERNFRSLFRKASEEAQDSIYFAGARLAEKLIETEQEIRVLHGDIHHENILESSGRGWLAIDPQCMAGERTYDIANAFYNPSGFLSLVEAEETISRRCAVYSKRLALDKRRILEFAFAYGCLSAAWCIEDGQSPEDTLRIARIIQRILKL